MLYIFQNRQDQKSPYFDKEPQIHSLPLFRLDLGAGWHVSGMTSTKGSPKFRQSAEPAVRPWRLKFAVLPPPPRSLVPGCKKGPAHAEPLILSQNTVFRSSLSPPGWFPAAPHRGSSSPANDTFRHIACEMARILPVPRWNSSEAAHAASL